MSQDKFSQSLLNHISSFRKSLETSAGDWAVKGFIDIKKNIYTISTDTKVISKIIELVMIPVLERFSQDQGFTMVLSAEQNHYPDITFIKSKQKIALDIKSTYRKDDNTVSGFTLGAFTGYFRNRSSKKNITFPYEDYSKHYILGVIYTKQEKLINEKKIFSIDRIEDIFSVVTDFDFIVQEKYKIAKDRPGSGNTKNIGSCVKISELSQGIGPFAKYGVKVFDDFWMKYMNAEMARQVEQSEPSYRNLDEYLKYRNIKKIECDYEP